MIGVGDEAPDFTLRDQNNEEFTLSSFRGQKAVLLVFYPLAFTGICTGELCRVRDELPTFQNDDVQVLTISVDSIYAHKVWAVREGFSVPLLADFWPHGSVASAYGVFNELRGYAERGTFMVDLSGFILFADVVPASSSRDASVWEAAVASLNSVGGPGGL